jgi:ferredoxin
VKVTIDPNRCQGHARCIALAPDLFELDVEGFATVREYATSSPEDALKAARNCPEDAITVSLDDEGRRDACGV